MMRLDSLQRRSVFKGFRAFRILLTWGFLLPLAGSAFAPSTAMAAQMAEAAPSASSLPEGALFSPQQLTSLLPATVYFQGRTASLQLRNSAGLHFKGNAILWAALVDTSGYASDVQERYEFYLVTEGPLRIGTTVLQPGAYGGGFPGGHFVMMDLGGHTLAQGPTEEMPQSARPRPLQLLMKGADTVELCLRRQCITIQSMPAPIAAQANAERP